MKKYFLIICVLLCCFNSFAQTIELNDTINLQVEKSIVELDKSIAEGNLNIDSFPFIYDCVPEFYGGHKALIDFLNKNAQYPDVGCAVINGKVICQFTINEDGSVSNIKIIKKLHPKLDEEVIRIIKLMPNWKNNKCGKYTYTLPFSFTLKVDDKYY